MDLESRRQRALACLRLTQAQAQAQAHTLAQLEPSLTNAKGSHVSKSELATEVIVNVAEQPSAPSVVVASSVVADRQLACTLLSDMISARKLERKVGPDSALDLMQQIKMNICSVDAPQTSLPDILSQASSATQRHTARVPPLRSLASMHNAMPRAAPRKSSQVLAACMLNRARP